MKKMILLVFSVFFLGSASAQMDDKFYYPDKDLLPVNIPHYSEIVLLAEQDTIYSAWIEPERPAKATILYFHGNGGNISKWMDHVKPLVDDGFQVCVMDYRGYGKSTGTPTHINIAQDAQLLVDTLFKKPEVQHVPFIVYGASIGTQVATNITRNNQDRISALVLDGMMASFTDVALATSPPEYHSAIKQFVISPYSAMDNIQYINNIRLLVIHSEEDPIPIAGARAVYEKATCSKEFWLYEGKHIQAAILYPDQMVNCINKLYHYSLEQ